jgi:dipeptidyl aminopeptidase/acylaminoacyl peptidase
VLTETSLYTRYQISYTSEWLTISGIMNIPKWEGTFPLLILNHGYIDTSVYTNGRWLKREQDYLANNGFTVLHTDYRNHAFSDTDESLQGTWVILRSKKYWADAINAILAVQKAKQEWLGELKYVDSKKFWMLWHSMGGWVTMYSLVSQPELISAAVLYAPVHSNQFYNFQRWWKNRLTTSEIQEINNIYGNSEESESFKSISPETYFENIKAPVQMYFGTNDESCPIAWWYEIQSALTDAWKDIDFRVYEGEQHEFWPQWENFMSSSVMFFNTHLR